MGLAVAVLSVNIVVMEVVWLHLAAVIVMKRDIVPLTVVVTTKTTGSAPPSSRGIIELLTLEPPVTALSLMPLVRDVHGDV